jgi:dTDP-4-dehydrorhamnose 3,5-epimerase
MNFEPLEIEGVLGIRENVMNDFRGTFLRTWDTNTKLGEFQINQASFTLNPNVRTLRGLHYQCEPFAENKVVFSPQGRIFDVVLDLREESPTFERHVSFEIGPKCTLIGLYIPAGCAHGYLTMEENSSLIYFMDKEYSRDHSRGVLWNDPKYGISWPQSPLHISDTDLGWKVAQNP